MHPEPMVGGGGVFRPVRRGNAFEETVERILQAINLGVVADGDRLPPERELAIRLNVSRVTLREAIRALQEAGCVISKPGRYGGSFVTHRPGSFGPDPMADPGSAISLSDTLSFRAIVEPGAAELAASRMLPTGERDRLVALRAETERAGLAGYRQADSRLHLAIAEAAGSPSLLVAVVDVRARVNDVLDTIPIIDRNLAHANRQHAAIIRAILAGEPAKARSAMIAHVEGTAALLRGFLTLPRPP